MNSKNRPMYKVNWWSVDDIDIPICEAKDYSYCRLHIQTGKWNTDKVYCLTDEVFFRLINQWNKDGLMWKYYYE